MKLAGSKKIKVDIGDLITNNYFEHCRYFNEPDPEGIVFRVNFSYENDVSFNPV